MYSKNDIIPYSPGQALMGTLPYSCFSLYCKLFNVMAWVIRSMLSSRCMNAGLYTKYLTDRTTDTNSDKLLRNVKYEAIIQESGDGRSSKYGGGSLR